MNPREVRTKEDALAIVEERGVSHVKIGLVDLDGVVRGKYLSRDKFISAVKSGFCFTEIFFGWDIADQICPEVTFSGWHTGYPDLDAKIVPETCRELPEEGGMLFFLGEFIGRAAELCPRNILQRVLQQADDMGFAALVGSEFEFFAFEETPDSVREKGYLNLTNMTPGWFGYSVLRTSANAEFYEDLIALSNSIDAPLEGLHTETGPGVVEAAIAHTDALSAADRAVVFKTFSKVMAQRRGKMLTFMARWSSDMPGQSGHLHMSLTDKDGKPVFFDADKPHSMSDAMRWFVGGQQALMPEFVAMIAHNVNSYARLVPGTWAPTDATWGVDNRTCAIRVIPGSPKSQRLEYRVPAADMNPYLAFAASLASGLWGIENKIEPDAPIEGNSYELDHPENLRLPERLADAANRLEASKVAREIFGDVFVEHFAATRRWEEREFQKAVTNWELDRYFELT